MSAILVVIQEEIQRSITLENPMRLEYTRRAYQALPFLSSPGILDIGCGRGQVALTLVQAGARSVTGLDLDAACIREFIQLSHDTRSPQRMQVVRGSMLHMPFCKERFDVLWSEGSILFMGFESGLRAWRRMIKPNGFLVVHVMTWLQPDPPEPVLAYGRSLYAGIDGIDRYVLQIADSGYDLLEYFLVPPEVWWHDYYLSLIHI